MISGKAAIAGVIGYPVAHSLSPKLHGFWLEQYQIDGTYIPLEVAPENLEHVIKALPMMGIKGVNITVPHKEAVMALMDEIEPVARHIGAVNTVIIHEGRLIGTNTDAYGFIENIRANAVPSWQFNDGKAVVIGAGGAARAVVSGLIDAGVPEIILVNRTREKAEAIAAHIEGPIKVVEWERRSSILMGANMLVNTSTLGMEKQPPLDISLEELPFKALVTDIVYKPLVTPLLAQAHYRGNPTVDGIGMLLHQAVAGFHAWFGVKPVVTDALKQHILG